MGVMKKTSSCLQTFYIHLVELTTPQLQEKIPIKIPLEVLCSTMSNNSNCKNFSSFFRFYCRVHFTFRYSIHSEVQISSRKKFSSTLLLIGLLWFYVAKYSNHKKKLIVVVVPKQHARFFNSHVMPSKEHRLIVFYNADARSEWGNERACNEMIWNYFCFSVFAHCIILIELSCNISSYWDAQTFYQITNTGRVFHVNFRGKHSW